MALRGDAPKLTAPASAGDQAARTSSLNSTRHAAAPHSLGRAAADSAHVAATPLQNGDGVRGGSGGSGPGLLGQKHNWRCNAHCALALGAGASAKTQGSSDGVAPRRGEVRTRVDCQERESQRRPTHRLAPETACSPMSEGCRRSRHATPRRRGLDARGTTGRSQSAECVSLPMERARSAATNRCQRGTGSRRQRASRRGPRDKQPRTRGCDRALRCVPTGCAPPASGAGCVGALD